MKPELASFVLVTKSPLRTCRKRSLKRREAIAIKKKKTPWPHSTRPQPSGANNNGTPLSASLPTFVAHSELAANTGNYVWVNDPGNEAGRTGMG